MLLNHFPVIGTLLGSGLLLWGILKKQDQVKALASVVIVLMAVLAIPVFLTGEPAEESVEDIPGVSESLISVHESAAKLAIWLMEITGLASLFALVFYWRKAKAAGSLFLVTMVLSLLSFAAMARTGYYGGQIRHSEIRNDAAINSGDQKEKDNEAGENKDRKEKKDDD